MPMPRLTETHHNRIASAKTCQVNRNSAAMAPTWKTAIKKAVIPVTGCVNVRSWC